MPYKSDRQRRFFNANRKKLKAQGVDVDHWNQESKGLKLPETAPSDREVKVAMDALRYQARKQAWACTQVQIKLASAIQSPQVQEALARLQSRLTSIDVPSLLRQYLNSPSGRGLLMGAGAGAVGGLGSAILGGPDEDNRHHLLGSTLTGAGLGAAGGAALGHLQTKRANAGGMVGFGGAKPQMPKLETPQPGGAPGGQAKQPAPAPAPAPMPQPPAQPSGVLTKFMGHFNRTMNVDPLPSISRQIGKPLERKTANFPGAMPGQMPGGVEAPQLPPELAQLAQGSAAPPQQSPMELLQQLPEQLNQELQTRQQHLHSLLGDPQTPLADKLQALGKMLKGLPDPPKDPLEVLRPGGMAQPMSQPLGKTAGVADVLASAGDSLSSGSQALLGSLRDRLADPATRVPTAALLGAGAGSLASLSAEAMGKRKHKRYLNAALTGAAGGGLLGLGSSYIAGEMGKGGPKTEPVDTTQYDAPARELLGQLSGDTTSAAQQLNSLTKDAQPSLGEYLSRATGTALSTAPVLSGTAAAIGVPEALRNVNGLRRAWLFENRSQRNTDPSHAATASKGVLDRVKRIFHNPDFQPSMLHRVAPSERADAAANFVGDKGMLKSQVDRLKNLFSRSGAQEALLTDPSKLPEALGVRSGGNPEAELAKVQNRELHLKRLKSIIEQREKAGKGKSDAKPSIDVVTGVKAPDDSAKRQGRLARAKTRLPGREQRLQEQEFRARLENALTPENRHALVTELNRQAADKHPERTPVYHSRLRDAHRPAPRRTFSLGSRAGRGALGAAGAIDALRLLGQYLTNQDSEA